LHSLKYVADDVIGIYKLFVFIINIFLSIIKKLSLFIFYFLGVLVGKLDENKY
jgi:hypothetical protein